MDQKEISPLSITSNQEQSRIELTGDLIFPYIDGVRKAVETAISASVGDCILDFSNVQKVDSSSLSLCLCFLRLAKKQQKQVTFVNLPKDMISIADLVDLKVIAHSSMKS
ncbi:STAS domain-containing protein [Neptunomonas sp.]|uniref:STAS domain-containing protein n=1 Tax=Neptunomonas sp. TaxID=1971898 RepID=UPI0025D41F28|nr:STAS domain-containing protein [Neptunomonas sp.]